VPNTSTDALEARLARLEDERAIARTMYEYASAIDYGDRALFLDCFTEDADWRVTKRFDPDKGVHVHGHEELGKFFDWHTHAPDAYHKHITINSLIDCDGDTARATSYTIRVDSLEVGPAIIYASSRYVDEFVRGADGRWRFRSRTSETENM